MAETSEPACRLGEGIGPEPLPAEHRDKQLLLLRLGAKGRDGIAASTWTLTPTATLIQTAPISSTTWRYTSYGRFEPPYSSG